MADHFVVEIELDVKEDDRITMLLGPFRQEEAAEARKVKVERLIARRDSAADEEQFGWHSWTVTVRPLWKPALAATVITRLADIR